MERFYFIIDDEGTLVETEKYLDLTDLSGSDKELTLLERSDVIVRAKDADIARAVVDEEYLETGLTMDTKLSWCVDRVSRGYEK